MTEQELFSIRIDPPDGDAERRAGEHLDALAKPIDGFGVFEETLRRLAGIYGSEEFSIEKRAAAVFMADHGIVEEGVTQCGRETTGIVADSMGNGTSMVCRMAAAVRCSVVPVDVGIADDKKRPGVLDRKVRKGTRNFTREPAMTAEETLQAVSAGISLAGSLKEQGYAFLATGEMGIGNTTAASALTAALTGRRAEELVGRGAGLSDEGLERKVRTVRKAVSRYGLYPLSFSGMPYAAGMPGAGASTASAGREYAFRALSSVGGLEIAALAGMFIGGALHRVPVAADGAISLCALLTAECLCPGTARYAFASHLGKEPAAELIVKLLGLKPVITAEMGVGEGTGAVLLFGLLYPVKAVYDSGPLFSRSGLEPYRRY